MIHVMPDWSTLSHAYGPATDVPALLAELRTPGAARAVDRFHAALLHQGSVYDATVAVLPLLADLAADPGNPARDAAIELLADVAREVASEEGGGPLRAAAAADLRGRAAFFVALASDRSADVRQAAIPALGLLLTDLPPIAALFPAATTSTEQLLVLGAAAALASRVPGRTPEVLAWFETLPDDPIIRLAVIVHRSALEPGEPGPDVAATVVGLLRPITDVGADWQIHLLLAGLHHHLRGRAADHLTLITVQLRRPATSAFRIGAIRMAAHLMSSMPPSDLLVLVAEQLAVPHSGVVAEAAAAIEAHYRSAVLDVRLVTGAATAVVAPHPAAGPVREALTALVTRLGPSAASIDDPLLRGAHEDAVRALRHLGDATDGGRGIG